MSEHWPAPWTWDGTYPIAIKDSNGHHVVSQMTPSSEVNVPLIKTAPDMLAYLKVLRNDILEHGLGLSMVTLETLIAKAEGK